MTAQVYDAFVSLLVVQASLLVALGLVLAVLSWLLARGGRRPGHRDGCSARADPAAGRYSSRRSTTVAIPWPTPMHIVARP